MPIVISGLEKNLYYNLNQSAQFRDIEKFKVWTFTDEIPAFLEVSVDFVSPTNPIKLKELEHYLPSHMHFHRDNISRANFNVFAVEYNDNYIFSNREIPIDFDRSEKEFKDNMTDSNTQIAYSSSTITNIVADENRKKKVPLIPFRIASGKVFAATKDRGSDVVAVKDYLKNQRLATMKENGGKKKKKKKDDDDDDDLDE